MKKIFTMMLAFLTLSIAGFAHGKHKKPVFESSVVYKTCNENKAVPITLQLGKSEGKDLLYIPGWGRVFLTKTDYGYQDINNNFTVFTNKNGSITIGVNVTMMDLNHIKPEQYPKGTFFHSFSGYLHSHVYPKLENNIIKIGDKEYKVIKTVNEFDGSALYTEENGRFTFLLTRNWNNEQHPIPDVAEFKMVQDLCPLK
ncbi:hypothetical protein [Caviibacter abscessus]|uniref:hypothetical protein n=1 Tax=Caviibacter abscessus TaxID=1766719 RepID=UPI000835C903|nr:hypothetical protein [Caviibacter abscessus]